MSQCLSRRKPRSATRFIHASHAHLPSLRFCPGQLIDFTRLVLTVSVVKVAWDMSDD